MQPSLFDTKSEVAVVLLSHRREVANQLLAVINVIQQLVQEGEQSPRALVL
jgi:hypothetical protein